MTRRLAALAGAGLLLLGAAACGDDEDGGAAATTSAGTAPTTAAPATTAPGGATTATTAGSASTTATTAPAGFDGPVLWPVGDIAIEDPVEVATQFVAAYLPDSDVEIGEFQQGDNNSGEVPIIGRTENGGPGNLRTTLLLRRCGGGWCATAAVNEFVKVVAPEAGATVTAGPVGVEGVGRGFEATVVVAVVPHGGGAPIAQAVATGGAFAEPEPFTAELDLSGAGPGTVVLLLHGGTGLERDPGEFSAIPLVLG